MESVSILSVEVIGSSTYRELLTLGSGDGGEDCERIVFFCDVIGENYLGQVEDQRGSQEQEINKYYESKVTLQQHYSHLKCIYGVLALSTHSTSHWRGSQ